MIALSLWGCGVVVTPDTCASDTQCTDAFGWGHTCTAGSCVAAEPTAACATSWPPSLWEDRASERETLVVGSLIDAAVYPMERDAVRLAVDQVNDLGGVDGHRVGVLECDASADDDLAAIGAYLASDAGLAAVIGPVTSADTAVVTAAAPELVLVSPGAGAIGLGGSVWRTVPSDADIAQAMVRAMIDEGLGKAAIVHSRAGAQAALADALAAAVAASSVEYPELASELFPFDSATERNSRVVDAAYANADSVVFLSEDPTDNVEMLLAAGEVPAYGDLIVFVGPAAYRSELLEQAGAASALFDNLRGIRSATRRGAVADGFNSSFASAYGGADADQSTFAGQAYDSAWATWSAMVWSGMRTGAITPSGIDDGLGVLSFGLPLSLGPSGWNELVETFQDAGTVDLDGASSPLDFDATSHAIRGPVAVWTVRDGAFETIREYAF